MQRRTACIPYRISKQIRSTADFIYIQTTDRATQCVILAVCDFLLAYKIYISDDDDDDDATHSYLQYKHLSLYKRAEDHLCVLSIPRFFYHLLRANIIHKIKKKYLFAHSLQSTFGPSNTCVCLWYFRHRRLYYKYKPNDVRICIVFVWLNMNE